MAGHNGKQEGRRLPHWHMGSSYVWGSATKRYPRPTSTAPEAMSIVPTRPHVLESSALHSLLQTLLQTFAPGRLQVPLHAPASLSRGPGACSGVCRGLPRGLPRGEFPLVKRATGPVSWDCRLALSATLHRIWKRTIPSRDRVPRSDPVTSATPYPHATTAAPAALAPCGCGPLRTNWRTKTTKARNHLAMPTDYPVLHCLPVRGVRHTSSTPPWQESPGAPVC
ncbi:hypothetical protein GGR56DRAFT_97954 [Xylariaceae sp. FL0804]|nr:hypothetical protein GGR56DRAFT_97954 [Xylariaceae sp. FL0804]